MHYDQNEAHVVKILRLADADVERIRMTPSTHLLLLSQRKHVTRIPNTRFTLRFPVVVLTVQLSMADQGANDISRHPFRSRRVVSSVLADSMAASSFISTRREVRRMFPGEERIETSAREACAHFRESSGIYRAPHSFRTVTAFCTMNWLSFKFIFDICTFL